MALLQITYEDMVSALEKTLSPGDKVMLHADTMVLAQLSSGTIDERMTLLLKAFLTVLGGNGELIVPAFSYSFCRNESFDPEKTRASKTLGPFAEFARQHPLSRRTLDPIFSVSIFGNPRHTLLEEFPDSCFGDNSIFEYLHKQGGKLMCLGCSLNRITMTHYLEQTTGVDYRYCKAFSGDLIIDGSRHRHTIDYLVRDLDLNFVIDLSAFHRYLERRERLLTEAIGRIAVHTIAATDFMAMGQTFLKAYPHGLMRRL